MYYTCDALLPRAEKYASLKFRRIARRFNPFRLDYGDALELAAFLHVVPIKFATRLFEWDQGGVKAARTILYHFRGAAEEFAKANLDSVTVQDGITLIQRLREYGWNPRMGWPDISKRSIRQLHHDGAGPTALARELDVDVDQVTWITRTHTRGAEKSNRAVVGLAVG